MRSALLLVLVAACGTESPYCAHGVSIDIAQFTSDAYNAVVRTSGGGSIGVTWKCTGGGTAMFIGTANTQTVTYEGDWHFVMCTDTVNGSTLTLDGTLHLKTTNGSMTSTDTEIAHSDALKIYGYDTSCDVDPIDNTCVVDYSITPSGDTASVCGITYP